MHQVIRKRTVVKSGGQVQVQASSLREGAKAEVIVIVDEEPEGRNASGEDRSALYKSIAEYAARHAGTSADLDSDLVDAAVEFLLQRAGDDAR